MAEQQIEVIYYYVKKGTSVVVNYVDEQGGQIAEPETKSGKVGDNYTTEAKNIYGYELISTPENASGTMTVDTIVVNYVYRLKDATVITKYVNGESWN